MAEQSTPLPVSAQIVAHLEAAIGGEDPTANVVRALHWLLTKADDVEQDASSAELERIDDRLCLAAFAVARDVSRWLPDEQVHVGIGAARVIVRQFMLPPDQREPPALHDTCIQYVALLLDQLNAVGRHRYIQAAGDPLRRAARLAEARATMPGGVLAEAGGVAQ